MRSRTPWKVGATALEELAQYVEHYGDWQKHYGRGLARYLLQHGKEYAPAEPTPEETAAVRQVVACFKEIKGAHFQLEHCFANAQRFVWTAAMCGGLLGWARTIRVEYVEGVAWRLKLAHHGWVAVNGKVLDVTWATSSRRPTPPDAVRVPWCIPGYPVEEAAAKWGACLPGTYFGVPFDWATTVRYLGRDHPAPGNRKGWRWGCILLDEAGQLAGPTVCLAEKPVRLAEMPQPMRPAHVR